MSTIRIIKKYPNRRLYDTETSCYITLEDIRQLVLSHTAFQVIDARSTEDLTNTILLQVISAQESGQAPFLTTEILQGIIRFHDNPAQKMMGEFLEKAFEFFSQQQKNVHPYLDEFTTKNTFEHINQWTQKNIDFWNHFFQTQDKSKKE